MPPNGLNTSSPGLDLLYSMLYGALHPDVRVDVTSVSAARDDVEHERFRRMMRNQESLARCLSGSARVHVRFVPDMVLDFCRQAAADKARPRPDVVNMSPPWMLSEGEMHESPLDTISPPGWFVKVVAEIASALGSQGPAVYSVMVPYPWDVLKPVLGYMPGYALAESVTVRKVRGGGRGEVSSYHVHYIVRGHSASARFSEFVFHSH